MLTRTASHALHLLMEAALGLVAVAAFAACIFAWRLEQGPIDVTSLLRRWHPAMSVGGAQLTVGSASLAWEGFGATDQPLDIRVRDVALHAADSSIPLRVASGRFTLAMGQLLLGRALPRSLAIDGAELRLVRTKQGGFGLGNQTTPDSAPPRPTPNLLGLLRAPPPIALPPWLNQLRHLRITEADITVQDQALGLDWRAPDTRLELSRLADGRMAGTAHLGLTLGAAHTDIVAKATMQPGGTDLTVTTTALSPAALARLSPHFAALAAADLPIGLGLRLLLGPGMAPAEAQLNIAAGPGLIQAGTGSVALRSAATSISLRPSEVRLDSLRIAFAQAEGTTAAPPVLTASANATETGGRVHAVFSLKIDGVAMTDLGKYWPPGTGGGSRPWLVQNVTAGRAHDAHVEGSLDSPDDLSDPRLATLTGALAAEDITLFWLRPIPPLVHGRVQVTIEGPDSLLVTMDGASQDRLKLSSGSFIRITKLQERHQFGDIDADLSGPLPDVLAILNSKRLNLLSRSKMEMADPSGTVDAHLVLHVPLEDRVTMDQIPIAATAMLKDVHLGRVAGGYDLDRAEIGLKVDGDGLAMTGHGDVGGIPTQLGLTMDFRNGPPDQVLQHVTAAGTATPAQLAKAGLPAAAVHIISGGTTDLRVAYDARRDDTATLQLDADLSRASVATPFGWSKLAGPVATAGARVLLDHGHLDGVDHLHAEGPDLAIISRAEVTAGHAHTLVLEQLEVGRTRAHGRIGFPGPGNDAYSIALEGPLLDVSTYFSKPAKTPQGVTSPAPPPPPADDATGPAWTVGMRFDRLQLARTEILAPFAVQAASDGRHVLHAKLDAGAPGELAASIMPAPNGRHLAIEAADAGVVLDALGVADNLRGGRLHLDGTYADSRPGAPLSGTATLTEFNLMAAPAIGRLLQGMTLYGLADVLRGPGLRFSKLVAPFTWQRQVLGLSNARAFSPSLGITAHGQIDLRQHTADLQGTVVPAYFFNQLLGDLPLVGRVFSPEKGGGVFAARYSVKGPLSDPKVGVNPLSALTPGFLREGFGLLSGGKAADK